MIALLSPAKKLDLESPCDRFALSRPRHMAETAELAETLRAKGPDEIKRLMSLSDALAELNYTRFQDWTKRHTKHNSRPAALTFNGEVYTGLDAATMTDEDMAFAQDHLRILSGLYGVLRPLDRIQPYRLEMGTRLETGRGGSLYAFWGDELARTLRRDLGRDGVVVDLASKEYTKAVPKDVLDARIIEPKFLDRTSSGAYRTIMVFAKRARGAMARFIIDRRLDDPEPLKDFNGMGYAFDPDRSEGDTWVFTRDQPS